ncbi:MAG: MFS transporter [Smithellaceae bacterium]
MKNEMTIGPVKILIFLIELLNCYATIYYSNFIFFYLRHTFGFGEVENLLTAAAGGFVYIAAAWMGGKFAQRYGCTRVLRIGASGVVSAMLLGMVLPTPAAQVMVYCLWTLGICFTWPPLEPLISSKTGGQLPRIIGIYNVVWAGGAALAYFTAGILIENLGMDSVFWVPLGIAMAELILISYTAGLIKKEDTRKLHEETPAPTIYLSEAKRFLHMAWLSSPFSYVAINTIIPLIPSIAAKLNLSTGMAGIVCSLWMFARLAAFAALWQWTGWHYRFQWLAGAYLMMILGFYGILLSQSISMLLIAQIAFGLSIGLIYYSSLYYSMNVPQHQAANAGVHEAMIGAGLFVGPAFGAVTLYLLPSAIASGAYSVGGLLCAGFSGLILLRYYRMKP